MLAVTQWDPPKRVDRECLQCRPVNDELAKEEEGVKDMRRLPGGEASRRFHCYRFEEGERVEVPTMRRRTGCKG